MVDYKDYDKKSYHAGFQDGYAEAKETYSQMQGALQRDVWELYERYRPHLAVSVGKFGDELKELLGRYVING